MYKRGVWPQLNQYILFYWSISSQKDCVCCIQNPSKEHMQCFNKIINMLIVETLILLISFFFFIFIYTQVSCLILLSCHLIDQNYYYYVCKRLQFITKNKMFLLSCVRNVYWMIYKIILSTKMILNAWNVCSFSVNECRMVTEFDHGCIVLTCVYGIFVYCYKVIIILN